MSMSQDSIRHLVLSLGALALSIEHPSFTANLEAVVLKHKQKSLRHLRQDLSDSASATSDHNLVAVQLMCVLDVSQLYCSPLA